MYSPARVLVVTLLASAALALPGCATVRVNSSAARGADLTRYQTYRWSPAAGLFTGDPRLDNNPFFDERVRAAVEQQLGRRGFEKTSSAEPDLLLHYHASVNEQIELSGTHGDADSCASAGDCRPFVYDAGTLVLDFVDARTGKVVWTGWAKDTMNGAIDNQRQMEEKIDEAVARMLEPFPTRL
jgi:hypothetical protein